MHPYYDQPKQERPGIVLSVCIALAIILVLFKGCRIAHAEEISTYKAVNAIIGEAENQGYTGMLAVACAIRNRGTLKGVYGEHGPRVKNHKYSKATRDLAIKAWAEANIHDITSGADHWENIKAFGKPYWTDSCQETITVKDHRFFKC